jgi:hypothetical protein
MVLIMREISRRDFIISGGSALTLAALPAAGMIRPSDKRAIDETKPILHVNESGANLLFYLVNVARNGGQLAPRDQMAPSYLIVQVPPQSLHEEYFYSPKNLPPTRQLAARLSGPSFLVFRLWPNWEPVRKLPRARRIAYDVSAFLEWNDADRFALQTAHDVPYGEWREFRDFAAVKDVAISSTDIGGEPYDLTYYRKLIHGVLGRKSFAHISIFELPAGVLMTLIDPTSDAAARVSGAVSNVHFRVAQNQASTRSRGTIRERRYEWRPKGAGRVVRTVTERWSAEITVVPRGKTINSFGAAELPPALRAIGLVRTGAFPLSPSKPPKDCTPGPNLNSDYLPTLADEAELVFLNQLASAQFANQRFDTHADGPFRLTDLGGSLRLHYKNYDTRGLPKYFSLVEYEHTFEAGRDNYIKIARIGICPKTSLRMLHLAIAERKIRGGVSYVDYKEYCDWLDRDRDFPDRLGDVSPDYDSPIKSPTGDPRIGTKWLRYPFSRVEAIVGRMTPIDPVFSGKGCSDPDAMKTDSTFLDPRAFWVYREGVVKDRSETALLPYPHKFYDRNHKSLGVVDTAVLFLRRDFFDDQKLVDRWLGSDPMVQSLRMSAWDDGRHRIALGGQVVALTPDEGRATGAERVASSEASDSVANRPNQMATDWVECYFDVVRNTPAAPSAFDYAAFPVFPQVRQARVYIDHVQHYARAKCPSVIEYATEYLNARFEPGNPLKVIVAHTKPFMLNTVTTLGDRTIATLDPDLPGGWDAIKRTFRNAGESLGALVNPDPALERISLTKSALSLPNSMPPNVVSVKDAKRTITLDPRELFKSLDAELFAGIRLSDILGLLDLDEAPQYLLSKLPPLPSAAEVLAAVAADPIVQRAFNAAKNVKQTVDEMKRLYDVARSTLEAKDAEVRRIRAVLDESLPTRAKIEAAARDRFEAEALGAFQDVGGCVTPDCVDRLRTLATLEVLRFLEESGANRTTALVVAFLNDTADKAATKLLADYATINPNSPRYLELKEQYEGFAAKIREVVDWYSDIAPTLERPQFDAAAIDAIAGKLTLDSSGRAARLAELTERVFRLYELVKPTIQSQDIQKWRDALAKLDAARRLNVMYLKARTDRMLRDAEDACRTLPPAVFDAVRMLDAANACGANLAIELRNRWIGDRVAAMHLVQDRQYRRRCVEEVISNAVRKLLPPDIEQRLATAQQDLKMQLVAVQAAVDKWKRAATDEARSMTERFRTEFEAELAGITNAEAVAQAIATYKRVNQLLDTVRVQDVTTDWTTTRFQAADLGFLRFEPRATGETKVSMHAGVHMEMDPLSEPPLPLRSDAYAQTEFTAFRITFLRVIGVDFDRISFAAGTGKGTNIDVKIASVDFAGSLSFIQALQSLLAGLVDGLRVDLGPNNITIGYQSPTLDLSAPGFTFANFSIGLSLLVFFDRTPVRLRFALADVERKATIAAGIYGGSFFCALTMDTKRGVIGTDTALEMGAYFGIRFGPFSGYVKFMVGLRYTRDDEGVTLIGYFIAEGSLSVWVITVSARLYMGIISHNSVTEGFCIASYSVKVGFLKKTFEAGYSKRIAGAAQNAPNTGRQRGGPHASSSVVSALYFGPQPLLAASARVDDYRGSKDEPVEELQRLLDEHPEILADDFEPLHREDFTRFVTMHFATLD